MRSEAQKLAFALNCREIEKEGGDVLGFIEVNWPSYTPRATWYNLQRKYLHRQPHQFTEGKAIDPETERMMKLKTDKSAQLDAVLKIIERKEDPVEYLAALGYKCPEQAWADLKVWARKNRPEDREKLPGDLRKYYVECGIKKDAPKAGRTQTGENPGSGQKAVETVDFGGKQYERMPKPSPTCCQPARPSGVKVPDQLPEEKKIPLRIHSVESEAFKTARYEISGSTGAPYMTLAWHDSQRGPCELFLAVSTWRRLVKEIPQALEQLGL